MVAESEQPIVSEDISPEEARRYLIRFLGQSDLEEYAEIYAELAKG